MNQYGDEDPANLYAQLGVRPVLNAAGAYTLLGGSTLAPGVRKAMEDSNRHFVDMKTLFKTSGQLIADLLDAEAGLVTSGAAAALALASAACLTREHPERLEVLPDTSGIPNEILTQRVSRQKYDRCVEFAGAHLIEYGDANGTTADQLRAAITPNTVALHYFVPPGSEPSWLSLEAVLEIGHGLGLPVIVDAAGHTWPLDEMRCYTRLGADLVTYANKYFDGPHSTGLLLGKRELIELALTNSFVGFETSGYHTIGRPMKVDRQEVFATVAALNEWLTMDHEGRLLRYGERIDRILDTLRGVESIEAFRVSEREPPLPVLRDGVRIIFDGSRSAEDVFAALRDGDPSVWVKTADEVDNAINVSVAFTDDDEFEVVVRRLREVLDA